MRHARRKALRVRRRRQRNADAAAFSSGARGAVRGSPQRRGVA